MDYEPSYVKIFQQGRLQEKAVKAKKNLERCCLCPHDCRINRYTEKGYCKASDKALVSSFGPHFGEETELVGLNGSGTIFFGYCNLRCVYCQNFELSFQGEGSLVSDEKLAEMMLQLQNRYQCHNINFVSPTHYVPNILGALLIAAEQGLSIPIVYNCGGYEKIETLKLLDGVIDIYMPDFKYNFDEKGRTLSNVKNYPSVVKQSLIEMDRQVGGLKTTEEGIAYRGLIIRHLMMPGGFQETKQILEFISENLSKDCLINIMDQYYPAHKAHNYENINKRLPKHQWEAAIAYAKELGLRIVQ